MEANSKGKNILYVIIGLIAIIFLFKDCSCSCGSDSLSAGEYEYTDAVGHEYSLILKKDGSATLKMTSSPKSEIDEIDYRGVREGVTGRWTKEAFFVGEGTMDYMDIYIDGENIMLCADGYIYSSYSAMKEGRTSSGNRWSR
jgi:hypothetical protein